MRARTLVVCVAIAAGQLAVPQPGAHAADSKGRQPNTFGAVKFTALPGDVVVLRCSGAGGTSDLMFASAVALDRSGAFFRGQSGTLVEFNVGARVGDTTIDRPVLASPASTGGAWSFSIGVHVGTQGGLVRMGSAVWGSNGTCGASANGVDIALTDTDTSHAVAANGLDFEGGAVVKASGVVGGQAVARAHFNRTTHGFLAGVLEPFDAGLGEQAGVVQAHGPEGQNKIGTDWLFLLEPTDGEWRYEADGAGVGVLGGFDALTILELPA
jgi:hypothetical protein